MSESRDSTQHQPNTIMAGGSTRKRKIEGRTKVKTGCGTCRSVIADNLHCRSITKKIKCDEDKPFCKKCVLTGRTCDGYQNPFKNFTSEAINLTHTSGIDSGVPSKPVVKTGSQNIGIDIDILNRYFSTKTMFDVDLGCTEEARQILQASLTDLSIGHAVLSLTALREDLETSGDGPESLAQPTPSFHSGVQHYSMALGGLASNLSSSSSKGLKSALLCCQIFISIEQVQKNYTAMAQHIIRGLRIMHEYRARPSFVAANNFVLAHHAQLPLLDVFIIKLFAAPCKFADRPSTTDVHETMSSACPISSDQQPVESGDFRVLAPDTRTHLTRIATSVLEFLDKVSHVKSRENAIQLLSNKVALLEALESWLISLEHLQKESGSKHHELISVSFLRLFHLILKIVLLGALDSSPGIYAELQTENDRLQSLANTVGERVRTYITCSGIR
ncbi:hypothetical protein BKA65DRAFT_278100 [Rhexocercosporidium sp. MPI-PUGE-AT-0058]|nr:hypothetical protein BKA65DRAFT_278100 [Rhexocercosporidium sp. MPI-PUGE-AT-0058]